MTSHAEAMLFTPDEFQGSPLFEGYLASVAFFGKATPGYFSISRNLTEPIALIEIHIGADGRVGQTNSLRIEANTSGVRVRCDEQLKSQLAVECIEVSYNFSADEFETLCHSLRAILARNRGQLEVR
jgi:hypothetical protein